MWLAFVLSQQWRPYAKWRGTVFQTLPVAADLTSLLTTATTATGWRERESALADAAEVLLTVQRERGLPAPVSTVTPFWDRPYRTIHHAVQDALLADITDPHVARLPPAVGSIEQWADSVDILANPGRRSALQTAYQAWITG